MRKRWPMLGTGIRSVAGEKVGLKVEPGPTRPGLTAADIAAIKEVVRRKAALHPYGAARLLPASRRGCTVGRRPLGGGSPAGPVGPRAVRLGVG